MEMTNESQNQAPPEAPVAPEVAESAPLAAPHTSDPVPPAAADPVPSNPSPQPDTPAAADADAQAKPEEDAAGPTLTVDVEHAVETAALDAAAGVVHAHGMVSTWLQRVEAGLHVPLDELRALKERLSKYL